MRIHDIIGPFVYHQCPVGFAGSILYPLNRLKTIAPDAYETAQAKYNDHPDRRKLPMTPIPPLSCTWGDVVQCSPIHPHQLFLAQREAGVDLRPQMFFAIPRERVSDLPAVVFVRDANGCPTYEVIDWPTYSESSQISDKTREWYLRLAAQGRRGAIFVGIPHGMIRGQVDVNGCPIIDWAEPS